MVYELFRKPVLTPQLTPQPRSKVAKFKTVIIVTSDPTTDPTTGVLENIRDHRGIHKPLYTARFALSEVSTCHDQESIWVDVREEWLSSIRPEQRN